LLWPTRRILCCQGSLAKSTGAKRRGSGMRFGVPPLTAAMATVSTESAKPGARMSRAPAIGSAVAVVLRKERRLNIRIPFVVAAEEV
jgi:hypothetical protein